jgi:hypothetical protein
LSPNRYCVEADCSSRILVTFLDEGIARTPFTATEQSRPHTAPPCRHYARLFPNGPDWSAKILPDCLVAHPHRRTTTPCRHTHPRALAEARAGLHCLIVVPPTSRRLACIHTTPFYTYATYSYKYVGPYKYYTGLI